MNIYLKMKPVKWRFKLWFWCSSSTGYLNKFDLFLGRKKDVEVSLGESMVMQLSGKLKETYCVLFFENFLTAEAMIYKFLEEWIYIKWKVRSNRKHMAKLKGDKEMSRGESHFHYFKNMICCKWYDNKPLLVLATNVESMSGVPNAMRQTKGSATKAPVSYPNIIKPYNNCMGDLDFMDQKPATYRLNRKSKYRFYLRMFFDITPVVHVISHLVYVRFGHDISLLIFKIVVAKDLIGRCSNCKRSFPTSEPRRQKSHELTMSRELPTHIPKFQEKQIRCHNCNKEYSAFCDMSDM